MIGTRRGTSREDRRCPPWRKHRLAGTRTPVVLERASPRVYAARMPLNAPRDSTIAVVGDGFGSLIVYATAIYLGFEPEQIAIYGPSEHPVSTYPATRGTSARPCCAPSPSRTSCRPTGRRSPSSTPGRGAARAPLLPLDPAPLQPGRPGHPHRGDLVGAAARLARAPRIRARRLDPPRSRAARRTSSIFDEEREPARPRAPRHPRARPRAAGVPARARPGARGPGAAPTASSRPTSRSSTSTDGRYVVIGAGIASVNEWANVLDAGAQGASRCSATRRPTSRT